MRIEVEPYPGHKCHARNHEIMEMLGVKRLPPEGMERRLIQGFVIYVLPAPPPEYRPSGKKYKSAKHRIMVDCRCGRQFSVGRLHQHICKVASQEDNLLGQIFKTWDEKTMEKMGF